MLIFHNVSTKNYFLFVQDKVDKMQSNIDDNNQTKPGKLCVAKFELILGGSTHVTNWIFIAHLSPAYSKRSQL
jgi:hypothetical protein